MECAESVLMTMVRYPMSAQRFAVATETDVLPTPPFPVLMMSLMTEGLIPRYIRHCLSSLLSYIVEGMSSIVPCGVKTIYLPISLYDLEHL